MIKVKKKTSGSVKIAPSVLENARIVCKERGFILSHFIAEAIKEKISREIKK